MVPSRTPDYDLDDEVVVADDPAKHKAIGDSLRVDILDLVLERAASVAELATALDRPRSTVAYHVDVLIDAGLLRVVRTRKVRAIDERFYGRTGRTIVWGYPTTKTKRPASGPPGFFQVAVDEARSPTDGEYESSTLRHARIPADRAEEFFAEVHRLAVEFTNLEREGDTVYGFVAGIYPTDRPQLPKAER